MALAHRVRGRSRHGDRGHRRLGAPLKSRDVAALSLALIAATIAGVLADLSYLWPPKVEPVVLVVVTAAFGFALRFAFTRAEAEAKWVFGAGVWLASTVAGAASFLLLGITCGMTTDDTLSLGVVLGFAFGLALVPAALGLRSDWQKPGDDTFDRVLLTCTALVAVVSGLAVAFEGEWLKSYCATFIFALTPIAFLVVGVRKRRGRRALIAFAGAVVTLVTIPLSLDRRASVKAHPPFSFPVAPQRFAGIGPTDDLSVGVDAVCVHRAGANYRCWGGSVGYLVGDEKNLAGPKLRLGTNQACILQPGSTRCFSPTGSALHDETAVDTGFGRDFRLVLDDQGRVTHYSAKPHAFLDVPPASAIAVRDRLGCILTREGAVFCFGRTATSNFEPLHPIRGLARADRIAVRDGDAWARVTTPEGLLRWYAWNGGAAVLRPAWDGVAEIAGDLTSVCGRRADGAVVCADGTPAVPAWLPGAVGAPVEILPAGSALGLAGSSNVICARGDADVWCWGGIP